MTKILMSIQPILSTMHPKYFAKPADPKIY